MGKGVAKAACNKAAARVAKGLSGLILNGHKNGGHTRDDIVTSSCKSHL